MYHRPRSDRHIGRHARRQAAAATRNMPVRDHSGRIIPPPPPRAPYSPLGPLSAAVRAGVDPLTVLCWEALCATNPAGIDADPAVREAAYRPAAVTLAQNLRSALQPPRHRDVVAWIRHEVDQLGDGRVLAGRARCAAAWILGAGEWRWEPRRQRR